MKCTGCDQNVGHRDTHCQWCDAPAPDFSTPTTGAVDQRVADIRRWAADKTSDETCHVEQDELFTDVLTTIARGAEHPAQLATHALDVLDINFSRWYA